MDSERITSAGYMDDDADIEVSLRPKRLADYIGQKTVKNNLEIFIEAAKQRGEPLDHVLFYGPPGLGKTTLAGIIAAEMGVNLRITSGPAIDRAGDLAAILTNLAPGDVLFIDEIHNLVGTGDAEGSMNAANILKPALSRGELQVIGATTFNEYRKHIEKLHLYDIGCVVMWSIVITTPGYTVIVAYASIDIHLTTVAHIIATRAIVRNGQNLTIAHCNNGRNTIWSPLRIVGVVQNSLLVGNCRRLGLSQYWH